VTEYFIVFDSQTGVELWRGSVTEGMAARQELPEGTSLLVVPQAAVTTSPADIAVIRAYLSAGIDAQAEAVRSQFITPGSGQAMTYLNKQAEALAYLADDGASVPMLQAEAAAIGVTIADLAAVVVAQAEAWLLVGGRIEAARRAAKIAVNAAANLNDIKAASQVDWPAVIVG
jgi:hypothetical protein